MYKAKVTYIRMCMYIFSTHVFTYVHMYLGAARVTNRMATVTIDGLICGVNYTIIAGGTLGGGRLDGDLVGLRSSHGITMGPCSPRVTPVPTTSMTGKEDISYSQKVLSSLISKIFCLRTLKILSSNFY